jgi:wyosine [tRNA(Phe)-imidazoG37] synthetase (radical SAM superfamily)
MGGFLFDEMIFGPVKSRRLGNSLGINLLPVERKSCTFDCIYCECGWTPKEEGRQIQLPTRSQLADALETKLIRLQAQKNTPDSITFAGNGEPTMHPDFALIIDDTTRLRNMYFPDAEITVLSNSSMLHRRDIFNALLKIDNNILKLDAGTEKTFRLINKPGSSNLTLDEIVNNLKRFKKKVIIQTMFVRGEFDGVAIDNTTDEEVNAWLEHIKLIRPRYVMLYSLERDTAASGLKLVPKEDLYKIAEKLKAIRVKSSVY